MMRGAILAIVLSLLSSVAQACNGVEAEEGIKWCKQQCDVTHSQRQCDGSGYMATHARQGDANGVRDGFDNCHFGNSDSEKKQKDNVRACFDNNKPELLRRACNVYGGCAPIAPPPKLSRNASGAWSTPGDGRLVMLLRNTGSFTTSVGARVKVCLTNLTGSANVLTLHIWTTGNPWDSPPTIPVQQDRRLELGDCVEIDHPAAIIAQNSTVTGVASGYYELLELSSSHPAANNARKPPEKHRHDGFKLSEAKEIQAKCEPLPQPTQDFHRYCKLDLAGLSTPVPNMNIIGARICTGDNYVWFGEDQTGKPVWTTYPAGYLELIANSAFLTKDKPSPYDYNWSPITQQSCRDVIDTGAGLDGVHYMIGPLAAAGIWDPDKVKQIKATVYMIYSTKP